MILRILSENRHSVRAAPYLHVFLHIKALDNQKKASINGDALTSNGEIDRVEINYIFMRSDNIHLILIMIIYVKLTQTNFHCVP